MKPTLTQLRAGDRLMGRAGYFAELDVCVGVVSLSQRFVLVAQCGNTGRRWRLSEYDFNQAQFELIEEQKDENPSQVQRRQRAREKAEK